MKKIAWALALAAPMILASCGTESDVTLNETNVTIDYKGTTTLTASEKNGTWSSSDNSWPLLTIAVKFPHFT